MSYGVTNSSQTQDSSNESTELNIDETITMDHRESEIICSEASHQSVSEQIRLSDDPILEQVDRQCAILADRHQLNSTGNGNHLVLDDVVVPSLRQSVQVLINERR